MNHGTRTTKGTESGTVVLMRAAREKRERRICNLCKAPYVAKTKYDRFCSDCKEHNEIYLFHEWLPAC